MRDISKEMRKRKRGEGDRSCAHDWVRRGDGEVCRHCAEAFPCRDQTCAHLDCRLHRRQALPDDCMALDEERGLYWDGETYWELVGIASDGELVLGVELAAKRG